MDRNVYHHIIDIYIGEKLPEHWNFKNIIQQLVQKISKNELTLEEQFKEEDFELQQKILNYGTGSENPMKNV